uniref:Uncharacterized protein n=1 Tax=Steinernema glaseri TaxID=37863 RepID=A0A1I8A101_9BILA
MEDVRGDENVRDRVKPGLIPYGRVTEAEPTSPVYPRQFGNIGGHILSPPTMRYAFVKTLSIIHANSGEIVRRLEFPGVRLSLANKTAATSVISQEKPSAVYRVTSTAWIVITTGLSSTSFKTLHHWQVICLGLCRVVSQHKMTNFIERKDQEKMESTDSLTFLERHSQLETSTARGQEDIGGSEKFLLTMINTQNEALRNRIVATLPLMELLNRRKRTCRGAGGPLGVSEEPTGSSSFVGEGNNGDAPCRAATGENAEKQADCHKDLVCVAPN